MFKVQRSSNYSELFFDKPLKENYTLLEECTGEILNETYGYFLH